MATSPIAVLLELLSLIWCSLFSCGSSPVQDSNTNSYGRQVQIHSSVLYKVSFAISAEDPSLKATEVADALTQVCAKSNINSIVVKKKTFAYGWSDVPKGIKCRVEARGSNDFKVTVRGADGLTSINGETLQ